MPENEREHPDVVRMREAEVFRAGQEARRNADAETPEGLYKEAFGSGGVPSVIYRADGSDPNEPAGNMGPPADTDEELDTMREPGTGQETG